MNKEFALLIMGLFCLAVTPAFCDETNLLARWGAPTNALVAAADPVVQSVDIETLVESLGIERWDFLVQVPYAGNLPISFHWIDNGKDRELGHTWLVNTRMNFQTGEIIPPPYPPPYQFRILLVISPVVASTEDPWRDSAKLRVFIKEYEMRESGFVLTDSGFVLIENPFKNKNEGYVIYNARMAFHKNKIQPGSVEQAMGTEFDLMTTANDKR